jgi:hypothetical protein
MWDRVLGWVLARVMAALSDRPARRLNVTLTPASVTTVPA